MGLSLVCFIGRSWPSHRERERERDGGKSGIFSRERTERIFLKERDWRVNWFFEREIEICSYRFSSTVAVS